MKKFMALCLAMLLVIPCIGCTEEETAPVADIPVEKLSWTLKEVQNDGHSYVYFEMTNQSDVTIQSAVMTYKIKDTAAQEQKDQFIKALQQSQQFSDAFMKDYLQKLEQNGNCLNMTATVSEPLKPGDTHTPQQCYYMGGWTSKDMIFMDLFEPMKLLLTYEKNGATYEQAYEFATKIYSATPVEAQQQ